MSSFSTNINLLDFAITQKIHAISLGYTDLNPVRWNTLGPTYQDAIYSGSVRRLIVASANSPVFPFGTNPIIWFNPSTYTFYKSTNWKGGTTWEVVSSFMELFSENTSGIGGSNNSGFVNGVAQVSVTLIGSPADPNEAANKAYVDLAIAGVASGAGGALYGEPVQSIADLRAIDVSGLPDKHMRLCEDAHKIYSYDLQSTGIPDNVYIVAPLAGTGRWIAANPMVLDGGVI